MTLIEKNRFRMAQVLLNFLKLSPPAVLLLLPLLSSLTTALELIVNAILAAEETQITVASGKGSDKKAKKTALVNIADSVGRAILSFAGNTRNVVLQGTMKDILENLDRQADATLVSRCRALITTCNKLHTDLLPVGVTTGVRNILEASTTAYEKSGTTLRTDITQRKEAGNQILLLLKQATKLMTEQIDPLVRSLRDEDGYVREYDSNRMILNIGHRHTQFKGVSVSKDTRMFLKDVVIEFRNATGSVIGKSDYKGSYKELINPDVYDIIATHPEYETFIIEGVKIVAGEIKVENLEMIRKA